MISVSSARMREMDGLAMTRFKIPGELLMQRAGAGTASIVARLARTRGWRRPAARLFAGKGNNGGDAFVTARCLKQQGFRVVLYLAGETDEVRGDARAHLELMREDGIEVRPLPARDEVAWAGRDGSDTQSIVVDGVLGTGIAGPARGAAEEAIRAINVLGAHSPVVAIDVPSGLNADTGEAAGETVTADRTATMAVPKTGLLLPRAIPYVGTLEVVDIGMPGELLEGCGQEPHLVTPGDLRKAAVPRDRAAHKGTFGHVLVLAGARGYAGAAGLACRAALRSGTGLVTALVPGSVAAVVAGMAPEAMVHAGSETGQGSLGADCLERWGRGLNGFSAVLAGPGLTTHEQSRLLINRLLKDCRVPLVLDADGLNVCAGRPQALRAAACPLVITPHPGELGRLLDCTAASIQADRLAAAARAAGETGSVTVLKGAGTLVAGNGQALHVNMTGNPGMAAGGSGDVLGGLLAGLAAQGMQPFDAACAAVYLHGCAGDTVALRGSLCGLTAGDLVEALPAEQRAVWSR